MTACCPKGAGETLEISIDYLADLMFRNNPNDIRLALAIPELENTKDLFFFLLDLFCKGLVLLFGEVENRTMRVHLETLSVDQLNLVKKKMANAGVRLHLELKPNTRNLPSGSTNLKMLMDATQNQDPLESYSTFFTSADYEYHISFELIRP